MKLLLLRWRGNFFDFEVIKFVTVWNVDSYLHFFLLSTASLLIYYPLAMFLLYQSDFDESIGFVKIIAFFIVVTNGITINVFPL